MVSILPVMRAVMVCGLLCLVGCSRDWWVCTLRIVLCWHGDTPLIALSLVEKMNVWMTLIFD